MIHHHCHSIPLMLVREANRIDPPILINRQSIHLEIFINYGENELILKSNLRSTNN